MTYNNNNSYICALNQVSPNLLGSLSPESFPEPGTLCWNVNSPSKTAAVLCV